MRIALASQEYPPETGHGGIGTQTYLKAHGLAELGHDVHVISHSLDQKTHRYRDDNVEVLRIPGLDSEFTIHTEQVRWITYSAQVAIAVRELHTQARLDVVDFPEWAGEGYIRLLNQTKWDHIPTVIQLHGPLVMLAHTIGWPDIDSEFYRVGTAMERTCLRLADTVFSSSKCSAEWCAQHYRVDAERIPVLHTGVNTELFRPLDVAKPSRPTIVFVGKVARNKGVDLLLDAALSLVNEFPGLHLRVFGTGEPDFIQGLQDRSEAVGFSGLLDLHGFVQPKKLPDHLSRAHVFAAPSKFEGGPGLVYLEAMACGLPVIACAGSGAAEVIESEKNGLLVPPDDLDALADALRRLLSDDGGREAMGRRARDYVEREADTRVCVRRLEHLDLPPQPSPLSMLGLRAYFR